MPAHPVPEYEFDILLNTSRVALALAMRVATQNDWELVGVVIPIIYPAYHYEWAATMRREVDPP